ncbi:MAG: 4Fe-4S dicluster domain-containing protein [Phaeovulum sp.]|uniref:sulfate reduction electron transfer complex DsrMKJOP subunit DsrO n=1 Tax=Phaeovulum sp. TaxID=2934796 RepID=UPI0027323771|nr:4Fe-4S dicluster domain-containing protein [Phaeovulum sp.]MDP3861281.1 4Fe-4S dicluster domain-containing protein [Phaeovulum sp.]
MSDEKKIPASRRGFLTAAVGAATAAVAAITTSTRVGSAASSEGDASEKPRTVQYGMVIDVRRCIGCHACTVACKSEFDVPLGENRCWVEYTEKGVYPNVGRSFLPRLCNHCSEPPCVDVCPTNATWKREQDGIVVIDQGLCIGCKYCIQACPYDARFLNPVTGFADKCDFCIHRVSQGLAPSCVNTCVGGARIFGDLGDPESDISRIISKNRVTVLRGDMGTFPNVYYIDADHTDELDARRPEVREVRVTTHKRDKKRR